MENIKNIEQVVLASMINGDTTVFSKLSEKHFSYPDHKMLCSLVTRVFMKTGATENDKIFDLIMTECPEKLELFSKISAMPYFSVGEKMVSKMIDTWKRKELAESIIMPSEISSIENIDETIMKLMNKYEELLYHEEDTDDIASADSEEYEEYLISKANKERENKFSWMLKAMNIIMGSIQNEETTLVGAKSRTGKTLFALMLAAHLANNGVKVLFISKEMSRNKIKNRIIANIMEINQNSFRRKEFQDDEKNKLKTGIQIINSLPLYINTKADTPNQIRAAARKNDVEIVIIDYLQLLNADTQQFNREREVANVSRAIKKMNLDMNIPFVVLSQLNDEFKDNRPYGERAIRESKAPYHDADNVIYMHNPTKTEMDLWENSKKYNIPNTADLVEIIIDKQRDGDSGMIPVKRVGKHMKLQEYTRIS